MTHTREEIEQIEQLHNRGLMPDNIYYQINGKSLQENYMDILRKRQEQYRQDIEQQQYIDKYIDKCIDDKLSKCIETSLYDILSNLNSNISITI